jgi:hypothetical protein
MLFGPQHFSTLFPCPVIRASLVQHPTRNQGIFLHKKMLDQEDENQAQQWHTQLRSKKNEEHP